MTAYHEEDKRLKQRLEHFIQVNTIEVMLQT